MEADRIYWNVIQVIERVSSKSIQMRGGDKTPKSRSHHQRTQYRPTHRLRASVKVTRAGTETNAKARRRCPILRLFKLAKAPLTTEGRAVSTFREKKKQTGGRISDTAERS